GQTPEPSRRFQAESRGPPIEPTRPPRALHVACGAVSNGNARPPTQAQPNMPIAARIVRTDPVGGELLTASPGLRTVNRVHVRLSDAGCAQPRRAAILE